MFNNVNHKPNTPFTKEEEQMIIPFLRDAIAQRKAQVLPLANGAHFVWIKDAKSFGIDTSGRFDFSQCPRISPTKAKRVVAYFTPNDPATRTAIYRCIETATDGARKSAH